MLVSENVKFSVEPNKKFFKSTFSKEARLCTFVAFPPLSRCFSLKCFSRKKAFSMKCFLKSIDSVFFIKLARVSLHEAESSKAELVLR